MHYLVILKTQPLVLTMTMLRIFIFLLSFSLSLFASSPTSMETKKLSVSFSVPANSWSGTHEFHILNGVDVAGYYWKTSNDAEDVPDWSSERYNYRKTGNNTGNLTIINSSGEPTLLELSFSSSTTASCSIFFWSMTNGQLVKESYTGTATVTLTDLALSDVPIEYQVAEPSGYYAPASIAGGTLSAQDRYWSVYDESISFANDGSFSASVTNDSGNLSVSGSSFTYTKTGTNSATLSYTIDGAGYVFEYDFQFTGENAGIYSKYADYGGGTTDVTTGPFSLSGVAVPEQYVWEDYDDFSGSTLDTSKWEVGYFAGGETVTIDNGQAKLSGTAYSSSSPFQMPSELSAAGQGSTEGNTFMFVKDSNIFGLEAEIMIPNAYNNYEAGMYLATLDSNPLGSLGFELRKSYTGISFNYDYLDGYGQKLSGYESGSLDYFHKIAITKLDGQTSYYLNGNLVKQFSSSSHDEDYWSIGSFNDEGLAYLTYADNVRVLRQGTAITEPDPVTVVSDPNGQAVVVQVGEKYNWNSSLDGVTLWGVEQSSDGWSAMTMRFENGRNFGNQGFFDSVAQPQPYDAPYEIDENGYIKSLEDDGDYQYYNPVSVDDGVIGTIQNDEGVDSVADNGVNQVDQWFFTTRAAAEEYYYSKVNPKDWMWFDHYPWVYSNEMKEWLYFMPSGGTLMYFSNNHQSWRKFSQ